MSTIDFRIGSIEATLGSLHTQAGRWRDALGPLRRSIRHLARVRPMTRVVIARAAEAACHLLDALHFGSPVRRRGEIARILQQTLPLLPPESPSPGECCDSDEDDLVDRVDGQRRDMRLTGGGPIDVGGPKKAWLQRGLRCALWRRRLAHRHAVARTLSGERRRPTAEQYMRLVDVAASRRAASLAASRMAASLAATVETADDSRPRCSRQLSSGFPKKL